MIVRGCKVTALLTVALALAGCSGVVYERDPHTGTFVQTHRFRFSHLEDVVYMSIDSGLEEERQGKPPAKRFKNWQESWQWNIANWNRYGKPQYEEYLLRRRKELRLKDLQELDSHTI